MLLFMFYVYRVIKPFAAGASGGLDDSFTSNGAGASGLDESFTSTAATGADDYNYNRLMRSEESPSVSPVLRPSPSVLRESVESMWGYSCLLHLHVLMR